MGIDFLKKTAKHFHRSCQVGFESLKESRLFDPSVDPMQRTFLAELTTETELQPDEEILVRIADSVVKLYVQEREIGHCSNPPGPILGMMREVADCAAIGKIVALHPLSHTVDVMVT